MSQYVFRSHSSSLPQGSHTSGSQVRTVLQNGHLASKIVKATTANASARQLQSRVHAIGSVQEILSQTAKFAQPVSSSSSSSTSPSSLSKTLPSLSPRSMDVIQSDSNNNNNNNNNNNCEHDHSQQETVHMMMSESNTTTPSSVDTVDTVDTADTVDTGVNDLTNVATHPNPNTTITTTTETNSDFLSLEVLANAAVSAAAALATSEELLSLSSGSSSGASSSSATLTGSKLTFAEKLLNNLLCEQNQLLPASNFLRRIQKDEIQEFMRHDILEWLLRINKYFQFQSETFSLAVNYFDRFLSALKVKPSHLQLIAVTSLLIAAKLQEQWNTHPALRDLTTVSNMAFSCNDIIRMEKIMLLRLNWNLNAVSPHVLVHQIVPLLSPVLDMTPEQLARLITDAESYLDLAHLEYRYCWTSPSLLACGSLLCALSLSNRASENKDIIQGLLNLSNCDYDSAFTCYNDMRALAGDVTPLV